MFCSTVRRESALVSWNVRTTPSRATCASRCGASPWRNAGRSPDAPDAPAAEAPCGVGSAGIEHHLSSVAENALGPEHQQQHEPEAHEDEADLGHVRGGEQALG